MTNRKADAKTPITAMTRGENMGPLDASGSVLEGEKGGGGGKRK